MAKYIGIHITRSGIFVSDGVSNSIIRERPLSFLLESYPGCQKVFYDMANDVSCLVKMCDLTEAEIRRLIDSHKFYMENVGWRFTYLPPNFFAINKGGYGSPEINFTNMNQDSYLEAEYRENETSEDSVNKAIEAQKLATEIGEVFKRLNLGDSISNPSKSFIERYKINFPFRSPADIQELALKGCRGQLFETLQVGQWKNLVDLDQNGSFAWSMSQLPNIEDGNWIESNEIPTDASIGVAEGIVTIPESVNFHPFQVKIGKSNYCPTGSFENILTLSQIEFMKRWNLGNFDIKRGYWFIPNKTNKRPYGVMINLYEKKRMAKSKLERRILTRVYSGIYGSMLEIHRDGAFGKLFCPVIGFHTQVNSQLSLFNVCFTSGITPLAIMADGMVVSNEDFQKMKIPISDKLGEWKINVQGEAFILGTIGVAFKDKLMSEHKKTLAFNYQEILSQITENPKTQHYYTYRYSPITIQQAIADGDLSQVGKIRKIERKTKFDAKDKRFFAVKPKTGKQLLNRVYDSSPLNYELLQSLFEDIDNLISDSQE